MATSRKSNYKCGVTRGIKGICIHESGSMRNIMLCFSAPGGSGPGPLLGTSQPDPSSLSQALYRGKDDIVHPMIRVNSPTGCVCHNDSTINVVVSVIIIENLYHHTASSS